MNSNGKIVLYALWRVGLLIAIIFCSPLFAAFIDPVGTKVLLTGTGERDQIAHCPYSIAYGNNKAYVIYSQIRPANTDSIDFRVAQYDFTTGQWTIQLVASTGRKGGNEYHDAGTIVRDSQGYLEIFYAVNDAACDEDWNFTQDSPYYKRSLSPDNISSWTTQTRMPHFDGLGIPEGWAAFTPNGYLHVLLGHNSGSLLYSRRDTQGNWSSVPLIRGLPGGGNDQAPAYGDWKIVGNTIHLVWSIDQPPSSGLTSDAYYAKSADNGETWTNINGTASFTRTQGLTYEGGCTPTPAGEYWTGRTEAPCQYASAYRVYSGASRNMALSVDALSDGTVLVANFTAFGALSKLFVWTGTSWAQRTVDPDDYVYPSMEVTSDDAIAIYAIQFPYCTLAEFISRDRGATWQKTVLDENYVSQVAALRVSPPGQSDRILVASKSGDHSAGIYDFHFDVRTMTNTPIVAPSLAVSPTSVAPGGTISVTVTGGSNDPNQWVGVYSSSTADANWGNCENCWKYLNGTQTAPGSAVITPVTLTFTAPTDAGAYNFRLFPTGAAENRIAVSSNFTVTGTPGIATTSARSFRNLSVAQVANRLLLKVQFPVAGSYSLAVYDLSGKLRWESRYRFALAGENTIALAELGRSLSSGLYLVSLTTRTGETRARVAILK